MKVELVATGDVEVLSGVYAGCEQSPRRLLAGLGQSVLANFLDAEFRTALDYPIALQCRVRSSTAFVAISEDSWASTQLGVRLGRVGPVFADGSADDRSRAIRATLSTAIEVAASHGLDLLVLRVRTEDVEAISASLANGFVRAGEENVYLRKRSPEQADRTSQNPRIQVEILSGGRPIEVSDAERACLLERAGSFRLSHLGSNPSLSIEAIQRVYKSWTDNVIDGSYGDVIAVARIDDRVVGFFAWKRDAEISDRHGVDLLNRSWAVVSAERQGVLQALSQAVVERPTDGVGWIECETQIQNTAMNTVMRRIGTGPPPQRCMVLHRWA